MVVTAALLGTPWDHTHGNTLVISSMLEMRAEKSGWTSGAGNIMFIEDNKGTPRDLLTEYGLLTINNIDTHFTTYKQKAGHQLQNSAQLTECLLTSICPKMAQIVMAESHL